MNRTLVGMAILAILSPTTGFAWAHRGHALVANAAAYTLAKEHRILKEKSFDLEYYANVPDKVWKADSGVEAQERPEHYMNLEIYQRECKAQKIPFIPIREDFFKKYPALNESGGRAYWRVSELSEELGQVTKELRASDGSEIKKHQELQARWLLLAGVLGHYVGDLSMPLHVSENKDGELTGQPGIHSYFEGEVVDEIFPEISGEVLKRARNQWPGFHAKNQKTSVFDLMVALGQNSFSKKDELLELDRVKGRNLKNASAQYRTLILDRLTQSSLYLAEIWSRQLGWTYKSERFFNFDPKPAYIPVHGNPQALSAKK